MKAVHLQVDGLFRPAGLGDPSPRFSWHAEGDVRQTAYRIVVRRDGETVWDTGKVGSRTMNGIRYEGSGLKSRDLLDWTVTLWNEYDVAGPESSSSFEIGLLDQKDWSAKWIGGNYRPDKKKRYPVDCFRKVFTAGSFRRARLYASAKGVYDVFVNGRRIEDFILAPGITDYRKRIQYQTYDVGSLLREGENTLELRLADGWYRGSSAAYGVTNVYGTQTAVIAQLELDGTVAVKTDATFDWSGDGPIRFADLKDGEVYDANLTPSYSAKAVTVKQTGNLVASGNVPVREKEVFSATLVKHEADRYVFDFGQNLAGYVAFDLDAKAGEKLEITCAETLNANQDIDMSGIQIRKPAKGWTELGLIMMLVGKEPKKDFVMTPLQKVRYTCREGKNTYKTSFAVFGFRYIEVISGIPLDEKMFRAVAVYSDMEETGAFSCSNANIDRFVSNVRWSMKSNFLDIPTDCPTRERLGWTGDAQIFFNTGAYLMDVSTFFRKWLTDMEDAQMKNGVLPAVFPFEGVRQMYDATGTSVGWADAVYLIPYRYYLRYNDTEILRRSWPMIRKYADYLFAHLGFSDKKMLKQYPQTGKYVYEKGVHLGEWLEPEEFRDKVYGAKAKHPEECTAYLYYAMCVIGEIAGILGEDPFRKECEVCANGAKKAYNTLFVENGTIDTDRQAKLVRPLALGLLDGEVRSNVQQRLKKALENYGYCVGTGFLSTPFILPVLEEAGMTDVAYRVLENEKTPGWLSEVVNGATTVWENWEGDASLNHYSPGASVEWLFSSVLGINVEPDNRIVLRPCFSGTLDYVRGSYRSVYGEVKAAWHVTDTGFVYEVEIPSNTDAVVALNGEETAVSPGKHRFEI